MNEFIIYYLINLIRSTKSDKVYMAMLSRNEDGDPVNNFGSSLDTTTYSASAGGVAGVVAGVAGVSRASLGNYNALLSLSRMGSKEDDCNLLN